MIYKTEYIYIPVYNYVSTNQHGDRYRQTGTKKLSICKMIAEGPSEYQSLILLGSTLNVPVRFDFKEQQPYIELASGEEVKTLK